MPAVYETEECRGARVPWKDCNRAVRAKVPVDEAKDNNTGVSVRCGVCGTTNFISDGEPSQTNDNREAIKE